MQCPNCHTKYGEEDLYCRQCGTDLVERPSTGLAHRQNHLPSLLYNPQLPKGVAASVGAVALGFGIELLRRNLLTRLGMKPSRIARETLPALGTIKELMPQQRTIKLAKGYEMQETVMYIQRVIRRED
ncbi:zinc ribbon domain-containing protein [Tengunoibacter tsumagoiensis]|uniref:Zinc-ribbon domain-containing protein n=1 Tax=Tengunoibacter tsumagoiensis TaxID=2014871 RepID=A0A402A262_9CHLR|nr:zinc ribbon domain-containing protein [Tengunoibacter tsumagoiensis]GCE13145.1 hypothetical protein KTT_30040 [Tengunoibacter tsumagoiensis]